MPTRLIAIEESEELYKPPPILSLPTEWSTNGKSHDIITSSTLLPPELHQGTKIYIFNNIIVSVFQDRVIHRGMRWWWRV